MNSNELKSTPLPFWSAFAASVVLLVTLIVWWNYDPGQDHIASISLNGDNTWYHNYEINFEIQDPEILYHDIGQSISNAQQADIIFLGWSRLLFAIDWRLFEEFERTHHVKMFNLGLAGVANGDLALRIIRKHELRPKLWVINADRDSDDFRSSFFYMPPEGAPLLGRRANRAISTNRSQALKNVFSRNLRWRLKMAAGLLGSDPYRSATTGNWFLENFPPSQPNAPITLKELHTASGAFRQRDRVDFACPALPDDLAAGRDYARALGGQVILIQVPSYMACADRIHDLGAALSVPAFTVDPSGFSSSDGGSHLDRPSARKYSAMFFAWLEQLPEFQRAFAGR